MTVYGLDKLFFDVISKIILVNYNELFNDIEISNELKIYNNEELLILVITWF